jgi:nitrogen fixation NifU-like protein
MSELSDLYQEVILDHSRHPHNYHDMPDATRKAEGYNPLCGDQVTVFLKLKGDTIEDVSFEGKGCAISKSSASIMTTVLKGKSEQEAKIEFQKFIELVTSAMDKEVNTDALGKLAVFAGVREFPARVKCASLAWHTLHAALEHDSKPVSTE